MGSEGHPTAQQAKQKDPIELSSASRSGLCPRVRRLASSPRGLLEELGQATLPHAAQLLREDSERSGAGGSKTRR